MAKNKSQYCCNSCGASFSKWQGQCADCGAWNSLNEVKAVAEKKGRFGGYAGTAVEKVRSLSEVQADHQERTPCGIAEFDRVLGGGLIRGSVILLGGDPGIGKSTLLLQVLGHLAATLPVLYISGEESPQQISLRARRLQVNADNIRLLAETQVERILEISQTEKPAVLVADSVQTLYSEEIQSAPGSVSQVRESCAQLVRFAKQSHTALFLVGHVTKDGQLAGPRVLEHMVDTVLYFEGDSGSRYRVVRAFKNRFGAVNELGMFAMTESGLKEVSNPSAIFLSGYNHQSPGSMVMVAMEGSRPLLVEVQALVDSCYGGAPRRVTVGLDQNRLIMLLAVLHRHAGIPTHDQDVFINVVGGVRLNETAADLALLAAITFSLQNRPAPEGVLLFGEVGLSGEVRPVPNGQDRLKEAVKHGFTKAIIPEGNCPKQRPKGMTLIGVKRVDEALAALKE